MTNRGRLRITLYTWIDSIQAAAIPVEIRRFHFALDFSHTGYSIELSGAAASTFDESGALVRDFTPATARLDLTGMIDPDANRASVRRLVADALRDYLAEPNHALCFLRRRAEASVGFGAADMVTLFRTG